MRTILNIHHKILVISDFHSWCTAMLLISASARVGHFRTLYIVTAIFFYNYIAEIILLTATKNTAS